MILEFTTDQQAEVDAVPEPKHVWWDITRIVVYTEGDIPPPPEPIA